MDGFGEGGVGGGRMVLGEGGGGWFLPGMVLGEGGGMVLQFWFFSFGFFSVYIQK